MTAESPPPSRLYLEIAARGAAAVLAVVGIGLSWATSLAAISAAALVLTGVAQLAQVGQQGVALVDGRLDRLSERVDQALANLGLAERQGQLAGKLSGGWKQRLALAACMIHEPELLLLDEPTAGVDPKARRDFWDQIRRYSAAGVTTLVSTHYMDEAVQCDAIAYIAFGKKLLDAPTADIPKQIGLACWRIAGRPLLKAQEMLEADESVDLVARFGAEIHACSKDASALERAVRAVKAAQPHVEIEPIEAGFEEIFIYLMSGAMDNFQ